MAQHVAARDVRRRLEAQKNTTGDEDAEITCLTFHALCGRHIGMARDDELIKELRPQMCVKILEECTDYDMYELESQDNDERAKLSTAALTGAVADQPLESARGHGATASANRAAPADGAVFGPTSMLFLVIFCANILKSA